MCIICYVCVCFRYYIITCLISILTCWRTAVCVVCCACVLSAGMCGCNTTIDCVVLISSVCVLHILVYVCFTCEVCVC